MIIACNGSVQNITNIPEEIRKLYRTVWELPQKDLINLAAGRAPFIDQSQSLNIYMKDPSFSKISAMHFYGWEKGLKTGMYYLRSRPATNAIKFTVDVEALIQESCQGIELKHFNSKVAEPNGNGALNASNGQKAISENTSSLACPLRRKTKKTTVNEKGETVVEDMVDDDECLACGS